MFKEFLINVWKEIKYNIGDFLKSLSIIFGVFGGYVAFVCLVGYFVKKNGYMLEENLFNAGIPTFSVMFLFVAIITLLYLFTRWIRIIWIKTYLLHEKNGKTNIEYLMDEIKKDRKIE